MKNMKFRMVGYLRVELERLGYDVDWWYNYDYVIAFSDGRLLFTNSLNAFESSNHTETTLEELKAM